MNDFEEVEKMIEQKIVLVIDEDRDLVNLLSKCFCSIGMKVWAASDAVAASNLLSHGTPDLMILGADTPTSDGSSYLQFLDGLKDPKCQIPMIVLCKTREFDSAYRVQNLCAYYVHKSPQAWQRIEIFTQELVDFGSTAFDESTDENSSKSDTF